MNKFAWSIVYEGLLTDEVLDELEYTCHPTYLESGNTCLLVFWNTKQEWSAWLEKELRAIAPILSVDMSIEAEDKIMLLNKQIEWDVYETVAFEGIEICYEELIERFWESYEAVAIREAETSKKFWNRVVRVDFIY
jgi:hypothetical protein